MRCLTESKAVNIPHKKRAALSGLFPSEISALLKKQPAFRSKQIFHWVHKKQAQNFEQMNNLPKTLRMQLEENFSLQLDENTELRHSDFSIKALHRLPDGLLIESVLLKDPEGRSTLCLSSQAGCAMGCAFCCTGKMGLKRNLSAAEIIDQLYFHLRNTSPSIDNIVFMGMGEALANYDQTIKSIKLMMHKNGLALGGRRITLSTCGLVNGIRKLNQESLNIRLAVSLVTADPQLRQKLMPVCKANPLEELQDSLFAYQMHHPKRITLECVLLKDINTRKKDITALRSFAENLDVMINLIPWNKVDDLDFKRPSEREVENFARELSQYFPVTIRRSKGNKIDGACGQLGSENL